MMRIDMISTSVLTEVDGQRCRVWEGLTRAGVRVKVLVARIAVQSTEDTAAFEHELIETGAPHSEEMVLPLRMIL